MAENPFFYRGPIRDEAYFYDRRKETRRVLEMLSKSQSVAIIGPRKIGKSSLLFHLSRSEVMQEHGLDPTTHLIVYLDCQGLKGLNQGEFYGVLLREVRAKADQHGYPVSDFGPSLSYQEFEYAIRKLLDQGPRLSLLLDEFETLGKSETLNTELLLLGLRSLAIKLEQIAYVTVSQRHLAKFTTDYSPFFNIFVPLKIGLFDPPASREMIERSLERAGATLSPEAIRHILELGGNHPFFLQVAAYWALEIQNSMGRSLEEQDLHRLTQKVQSEMAPHLEYYWKHLSQQEQFVLAALPFSQFLGKYQEQLKTLICLCLVVQENGRYKYFSPLLDEFVHSQKVEGLLRAGPLLLLLPYRQAMLWEKPLPLSARQFSLLSYLVRHQGQVVSTEELDREVMWASPDEQQPYEYLGGDRVKSTIKALRKTLGSDCIVNKRGVGYMFQVPKR